MQTRLPWMNRADRARWRSARTLADLGRLTADWWEGSVRSLPGHRASHRPHPSLAAHVPVLAAANRAGFLVAAAQTGLDTARVRRKTAVQGFATDPALIQRLVGAAEKAGLGLVLHDWHDAFYAEHTGGITVTHTLHDLTVTRHHIDVFGQALALEDIKALWPRLPHAVEVVVPALQITLADPDFGPSDLVWDTLAHAIRGLNAARLYS
ncbi:MULTISPECIES: DUF6919 domain-containing protein [Streptomyces]|uniref:DUF6919 domain-containing protein n=4 Tax=Streptomyces rimosus TaxID=1927 RepID=L8F046_STRR1|nr:MULTISPECIES: hypothetical protein [Streptomyces]KOG73116.1 hypothetical protein ADK78_17845 [Kitasatospora aureofaciens]MYT42022.1 hypothetical protein [Streptomyces sp. SID5471]KEF04890.1 hypothetical protein DF17_21865 [Streptomyces rimosus]KOT38663.1 hypothetical protein ADK42_17125 [Streptomyces rimosus subsp. rimosus]KOT38763.1 hypothetical protein ADK84_16370 [Streptomyces sp. NRRL WC-3701]